MIKHNLNFFFFVNYWNLEFFLTCKNIWRRNPRSALIWKQQSNGNKAHIRMLVVFQLIAFDVFEFRAMSHSPGIFEFWTLDPSYWLFAIQKCDMREEVGERERQRQRHEESEKESRASEYGRNYHNQHSISYEKLETFNICWTAKRQVKENIILLTKRESLWLIHEPSAKSIENWRNWFERFMHRFGDQLVFFSCTLQSFQFGHCVLQLVVTRIPLIRIKC